MWATALKAAIANLIPTILKDLWERFRPRKTEPSTTPPGPGETPAPADTPSSVDAAPAHAVPGGDDDEAEEQELEPTEPRPPRQPSMSFRCDPEHGVYLIDADRTPAKCPCGEGVVVGVPWVRRIWPGAMGKAYWFVTQKKDVGEHKGKGYVQWTPILRESGTYEVWARIPGRFNRTPSARYVIRTANGAQSVALSQRGTAEDDVLRWKKLGAFILAKEDCFIRLVNSGGHSEGADSVGLRIVR